MEAEKRRQGGQELLSLFIPTAGSVENMAGYQDPWALNLVADELPQPEQDTAQRPSLHLTSLEDGLAVSSLATLAARASSVFHSCNVLTTVAGAVEKHVVLVRQELPAR